MTPEEQTRIHALERELDDLLKQLAQWRDRLRGNTSSLVYRSVQYSTHQAAYQLSRTHRMLRVWRRVKDDDE